VAEGDQCGSYATFSGELRLANAARQQKQVKALTVGLQNVSVQLELSKAVPQITATDH